jgi:hypothetical protein
METMSQDALMVVHGHVSWDYADRPDPAGDPYSYTGVEVTTCITGTCPETVELRHRGGEVQSGLNLYIPGMPRFEVGDEVLLFLEPDYENVAGYRAVMGMAQGHFIVVTEPVTGHKLAVQQIGKVTLAVPDQSGNIVPAHKVAPIIMRLEDMVDEVRKLAAEKGGDA